jgi:sensor histidine kinase regulating citrate/malate metabolism
LRHYELNQLLYSFSEGIAATDSVGVLTHYNPALMRMFGSVRVNSRIELIPDPAIWVAFDEVYRTGETQNMRYQLPGDKKDYAVELLTRYNKRMTSLLIDLQDSGIEKAELNGFASDSAIQLIMGLKARDDPELTRLYSEFEKLFLQYE